MSDPIVTLRLEAENRRLLPPVKQSQAAVEDLGKAGASAGRTGAAGIKQIGDAASTADRDVQKLSSSAKAAVGSIAALASIRVAQQLGGSFLAAADRAGQLDARMKLATRSQDEYTYAMERSQSVARASYQSINQVAEIAIQSAGPMRQLGFSVRDTLDLTEALSLSLVVSAANQQKSAATIDQFAKAMQTGVLRGQEFQTVLQNAPRFADALEQSLGKTRAELIAMANDGKLTVSELTKVSSQLGELRRETELLPTTLEDAKVRFADAWQSFAGSVNEAVRVNGTLVAGIDAVSEALPAVATAAGIVAVAFGGRLLASLSAATLAKARSIIETRQLAQAELLAARQAEQAAAARVAAARAGMGAAGSLAAAETQLAAAQARSTAAANAASIAYTAKAAAVRVASGAMALFGGPVGIAVTALTLFVLWARNSRKEAEELARAVRDGFQGAIKDMEAFNRETANESFAGLARSLETLDKAAERVSLLEKRERSLHDQRMRHTAHFGYESAQLTASIEANNRELETVRLQYQHLARAQEHAIEASADLILEKAGITNASRAQRQALEDELLTLTKNGQTIEQNIPLIKSTIEQLFGMESATRLAAAGWRELEQAAKIDWTEIDKALNQQASNAQLRHIELTQGRIARRRTELSELLPDEADASPEAATRRAQIEWIIKTEEANDKLAESQRELTRVETAGKRAADELKRTREQQAESQKRYAAEAAMARAELDGPLRVAEQQRIQRVADLKAELDALNISQADYNTLVDAAHAAEKRRVAEARTRQDAPRALLDTMTGELRMLGLLGEERERYARRLQNEEDMRRAINEANEAGAKIGAEQTQQLLRQARAYADLSIEIERNAGYMQDWVNVAMSGVGGFADLLADTFSGGIKDAASFFDELKGVFRHGWRDVMRTMLDQSLVQPIQQSILRAMQGVMAGNGFAGGGMNLGNIAGAIANGMASRQGAVGASATGSFISIPGMAGIPTNIGAVANRAAAINALPGWLSSINLPGALMGGAIGLQGGNGLLSRGLSGLSGLMGGSAIGGALTAGMTAFGGGAGLMGSLSAGLGSIGPVGWAALGASLLDRVTGGGLFGTSYKPESGAAEFSIGQGGARGFTSQTEVRRRSLFRGRQWRTTTSALDADAQSAIDDLFNSIASAMAEASAAVGASVPAMISGTFRQEFDAQGNLQREFGTIAGRVYNEAQEAFAERLLAENLLAVARAAGNAAEIDRIANGYRQSASSLSEIANFMVAVQADIHNGVALWSETGDGVLTSVTAAFERLSRAGETLIETYQRITTGARAYGDHIAGVEAEIRTAGLSQYQRAALDIETQYRQQTRTANELARALGLSGARAEDLASIEQLRAIRMADLQRVMEEERNRTLEDLRLSQYSPLTDREKLNDSMSQLQAAVTAGDVSRARQLSETALGLGRNLYASGRDYNGIYNQVTAMLESMGLDNLDLDMDDGTTMGELADILLDLPGGIARELFALLYNPTTSVPNVVDPPVIDTPGTGTTTTPRTGGGGVEDRLDVLIALFAKSLNVSEESLRRQVETGVAAGVYG
ncbi:MAG: tape measure protein [Luteimonas sp.]|nr:tape measure protein [Luteimonas sp.]